MSYTDMQYTNPGWTDGAPPPVNASNLNDISNALQAVNITQQERTTLGAEATDTLGQILAALKNAIDENAENVSQEVQNIKTQIGTNKYYFGSYIGNGQNSLTITFNFEPKFYFAVSENPQEASYVGQIYSLHSLNNSKIAVSNTNEGSVRNNCSFNGNSITISNSQQVYILNNNSARVYYIVFG